MMAVLFQPAPPQVVMHTERFDYLAVPRLALHIAKGCSGRFLDGLQGIVGVQMGGPGQNRQD